MANEFKREDKAGEKDPGCIGPEEGTRKLLLSAQLGDITLLIRFGTSDIMHFEYVTCD